MLGELTALPPDLLARFKGPYLAYKGGKKRDLADQQKILSPPLLLAVMHC